MGTRVESSDRDLTPNHRNHRVKRGVIGGMLAATALSGVGYATYHNIEEAAHHDINYLQDYPKKAVVVGPGDTANQLLNEATGGESGQLRADELTYIERQGTAHDPAGHPELRAGQVIEIPIPPADK